MTDHKFTVETPERVICFSITADEGRQAFEWMCAAKIAMDPVKAMIRPHILNELVGGFSAIAENRPYGGH